MKPEKIKVVFLGDQSVGKTSLLNRFVYDTFDAQTHVNYFLIPANPGNGFCNEEYIRGG